MQQTVCDGCGEPIDTNITYYTGTVQPIQVIDGVPTVGDTRQLDWHTDHLPTQAMTPPDLVLERE